MDSRSATTSPTGSVHSTPTHQTKPNTLDPFADIGNLSGSLGGLTLIISATFCHICHCQIPNNHYYLFFNKEDLVSPASPPLQQEQLLLSHPWDPHHGHHHLPSTQVGGSPTQEPISPRGNPALEEIVAGKPKDKVPPCNQSPAPATPPCLTRLHKIDLTTTSASQQWEEDLPVQRANHKLEWVRLE